LYQIFLKAIAMPLPISLPSFPQAPSFHRAKLSPARIAEMRELVEGTCRSFKRIGEQIGVSASTISRYAAQGNWRRPRGAALPARIGNHRERVTQKLWKLTERHAEALEDQPIELAQRSLQPLARLTRVLGDIDKLSPRTRTPEEFHAFPEPEDGRSIHELRDELAAHLTRILEEEGYGWEERNWRFEDGAGI
jgi:hypothetical protein